MDENKLMMMRGTREGNWRNQGSEGIGSNEEIENCGFPLMKPEDKSKRKKRAYEGDKDKKDKDMWEIREKRDSWIKVIGFNGIEGLFLSLKQLPYKYFEDLSLIVESDSRNAVGWVNNPFSTPWRLKHLINHIENLKLLLPEWQVSHIYRECNSIANNLAKDGVNRTDNLLYVIDP
ncbi:hypothetical protein PTKIN_Ptkin17bG0062500 [Pterospermum kingtungense]